MFGVSELSKEFRWSIINIKFKVDYFTPFESYGFKKLKNAPLLPVYKYVYRNINYTNWIFLLLTSLHFIFVTRDGREDIFSVSSIFLSIIWYIFSRNLAVYLSDPVKIIIPYCSIACFFSWYIRNALPLSYNEVTASAHPFFEQQVTLFYYGIDKDC